MKTRIASILRSISVRFVTNRSFQRGHALRTPQYQLPVRGRQSHPNPRLPRPAAPGRRNRADRSLDAPTDDPDPDPERDHEPTPTRATRPGTPHPRTPHATHLHSRSTRHRHHRHEHPDRPRRAHRVRSCGRRPGQELPAPGRPPHRPRGARLRRRRPSASPAPSSPFSEISATDRAATARSCRGLDRPRDSHLRPLGARPEFETFPVREGTLLSNSARLRRTEAQKA